MTETESPKENMNKLAMDLDRQQILSSIRFKKKATPIDVPTTTSRAPVSSRYYDLTEESRPPSNQKVNQKPSYGNPRNVIWDCDKGLIEDSENQPPSPKRPAEPPLIKPRITPTCQNLPLSESLLPRPKSTTSNTFSHYVQPRPKRPNRPPAQKSFKPTPPPPTRKSTSPQPPRKTPPPPPPPTRKTQLRPKRRIIPTSETSSPPPSHKSQNTREPTCRSNDAREASSCSDSIQTSVAREPSSSTSVDLLRDMKNTLSMRGLSIQTQPLKIKNYGNNNDWEDLLQPEDSTQIMHDPKSLCPFCDEPLPTKPSNRLVELLQYLKSKPEVTKRPDSLNPYALYLPFSDTASCCVLHRAEQQLIPDGIKKGWPTQINFQALPKRIRKYRKYLLRVTAREVDSYFMDMALKEWEAQGPRRVQSVANELATFQVEQPGYYGVRGYEVIYRTLQNMFLKSTRIESITKLARPLSPDFLLRKVLVPETAMCLISEDLRLKINDRKVRETLEESRSFGTFMFPDQDDRIDLSGEESELDELDEDDENQQQIEPPPAKRVKRKAIRKSLSCEIEILNPSRLSPRKKLTKTTTSTSSVELDRDEDEIVKQTSSHSIQGRPKRPNKPPIKFKDERMLPILDDGWESTISF